jgi:hypothetical protein
MRYTLNPLGTAIRGVDVASRVDTPNPVRPTQGYSILSSGEAVPEILKSTLAGSFQAFYFSGRSTVADSLTSPAREALC